MYDGHPEKIVGMEPGFNLRRTDVDARFRYLFVSMVSLEKQSLEKCFSHKQELGPGSKCCPLLQAFIQACRRSGDLSLLGKVNRWRFDLHLDAHPKAA